VGERGFDGLIRSLEKRKIRRVILLHRTLLRVGEGDREAVEGDAAARCFRISERLKRLFIVGYWAFFRAEGPLHPARARARRVMDQIFGFSSDKSIALTA
jgi:hypothetical protein